MKPTISNAFLRMSGSRRRGQDRGKRSIPMLSAAIQETDFGWSLALRPMRVIDVLPLWTCLGPPSAASTLLMGVDQTNWKEHRRPLPLGAIAARLGVTPREQFDSNTVVVDDDALWQLIGPLETKRLTAIRVEGPIEASDAEAIRRAMVNGRSPLLAELRAVAAMSITDDADVALHTRRFEAAIALVAENLRFYLAAVLDRAVDQFSAPPHWQIERLISLTGRLTVRPVETTVQGTSVDVAVGTSDQPEQTPGTRSLIYDLPSDTWHDEP